MLNNTQILDKVRQFGRLAGLDTDAAICEHCGFNNRAVLGKIGIVKTTPQLGTLAKFAQGLGVEIEDLIYNRTEADTEMSRIWRNLSEYEKTEVVVYIKMQQKEKNENIKKTA